VTVKLVVVAAVAAVVVVIVVVVVVVLAVSPFIFRKAKKLHSFFELCQVPDAIPFILCCNWHAHAKFEVGLPVCFSTCLRAFLLALIPYIRPVHSRATHGTDQAKKLR